MANDNVTLLRGMIRAHERKQKCSIAQAVKHVKFELEQAAVKELTRARPDGAPMPLLTKSVMK